MEEQAVYKKNDVHYLGQQQYSEPKESFKAVLQVIQAAFGNRPISVCDAGCASGAFLYYALQRLNIKRAVGFDIAEQLIAQAKEMVPQAEFYIDSVLAPAHLTGQQFDVILCLGTLSIFDDIAEPLRALYPFLSPGGAHYFL